MLCTMQLGVEQARKILGKKYADLSDTEVQDILESLYVLANKLLDSES